jgi:serine/threonine protein kinase
MDETSETGTAMSQTVDDAINSQNISKVFTMKTENAGEITVQAREFYAWRSKYGRKCVIGAGKYGTVSKFKVARNGVTVKPDMAVKVVRYTGDKTLDGKEVEQFEGRFAASKSADDCEFIVRYYGVTKFDMDLQIFMEKADGSLAIRSGGFITRLYKDDAVLARRLGQQPGYETFGLEQHLLPEFMLGRIFVCMVNALDFLRHLKNDVFEFGVIHKDVKPENILYFQKTGIFKLTDYGVSNDLAETSMGEGEYITTEMYMAPENYITPNSHSTISPRIDIWSLGVSLLELAIGRYPMIENSMARGHQWRANIERDADFYQSSEHEATLVQSYHESAIYVLKRMTMLNPHKRMRYRVPVNNQDPSRITDPEDEKCYLGPTDKNDPLWAIDGLTGCEFYQRYTGDAEKENVERVVKFFQDYENERRAI